MLHRMIRSGYIEVKTYEEIQIVFKTKLRSGQGVGNIKIIL